MNCAEVFDYRNTCIKCKFGVVIAVIFFMIFMCGCTDVNGTIPSEKEVLEEVKSICTSEEFELVSCVDISDGTPPACMEYTFVTKERVGVYCTQYTEEKLCHLSFGLVQQGSNLRLRRSGEVIVYQ